MGDLISKSELIKAMENKYEVADKTGLNAVGLDCGFIITERIINEQPTVDAVPLSEIYRVISGHSNYHGDSILSALTCIAEGKEVKPIKPLE